MQFSILGPLEVREADEALPLPEGKQRTLLALLLLHANEVLTADRLVEELWEGEPPATAANTLQVYVSRLRKLLGRALERRGHGYALRVEEGALDLHRFQALAAAGRHAEALALWRGPVLADVELTGPARTDVARVEEERLAVLEARLQADLDRGVHAQLVAELEALVREHPLRERLRAQLMLALYRAGRQAEALEVYRRTRDLLAGELGLDPSRELQELERAILRQDASLSRAAAPALPAAPTILVGRSRELEEIVATLRRTDVRLLTLTGTGGIGKTRLALEAARTLAPELGGRAALVTLAAIVDPQLVVPTIAGALGVAPAGGESAAAALASYAGTAPLLLVLDNFEQLLDAAPQIADLLARAPTLELLVTSRAPLRIAGEYELSVPPLDVAPSVDLFVARATAVGGTVAADAPEVAEICARLEGLPLAIELAAARTKLLPAPALLARLGNRLDLLKGGLRDAPERQQTLRTTIDWSYDLLEEDEQRLFAQLAVFGGGCTLEAVDEVCDAAGDALELLASLVDKSLLRREGETEPRFSMLETVREYALERLGASDDERRLRERHASFFVALAERAEEWLHSAEQKEWLDRLEVEHDNLRAAGAFLLEADPGEAVRLGGALRRFWQLHGHLQEGRRILESALAAAPVADTLARAKALNGLGILIGEQGDLATARGLFEQSLAVSRAARLQDRIAASLANLANIDTWEGNFASARRRLEEVEAIWTAIGNERGVAVVRGNLGVVLLREGDLEGAAAAMRGSANAAGRLGDHHQVALALRDLARIAHTRGRFDEARDALTQSLALMRELGQRHGIADCLEGLAGVAVADGDEVRAARLFGAADAIRASIGAARLLDQQEWYEQLVEQTRSALGDERFALELEIGRALDVDAAAELAAV